MANKNVPSNNPEYRKRKRVQKEFTALLEAEGHEVLFGPVSNALPEKKRARQNLRRTKLILDAIKYGFHVPQSMRDEVNKPPDENPRCLIPDFDGAILSNGWRDALWARFYTGAPPRQRQSVERYSIVKRA